MELFSQIILKIRRGELNPIPHEIWRDSYQTVWRRFIKEKEEECNELDESLKQFLKKVDRSIIGQISLQDIISETEEDG